MIREKLKSDISTFGFFSLAFGSMIGVGWITAIGAWFTSAGPGGAMIAFAMGGLLMMFIGLCYAEVTSMIPVAGGEVAYAYKAFGTAKAFVIGVFLAFGYLSVSAFEAISVGKVLGYLIPSIDSFPLYSVGGDTVFAPHLLLAAVFTGLVTYINWKGPRFAVFAQIILTYLFLGACLIFIGAGLISGSFANLQPVFASGSLIDSTPGILAIFVTAPFWFVGFDTIPQAAEEAQKGIPKKKLGLLIIGSIVAATFFYLLLIFSAGMSAPWQSVTQSSLPIAESFKGAFGDPRLSNLVLVAALLGLFTSWNGFFLAGSRVLFALGRGRLLPFKFGNVHKINGTPTFAVLFTGLFTFVSALLGRGAMIAFIDVGSLCIAVAFLGVSLSFLKFRKAYPDMKRPYKIKYPKLVGYSSVVGSLFIIASLLVPVTSVSLVWPLEWLLLLAIVLLALVFWHSGKKSRNSISEKDRKFLILEDY